MNPNEAVLDGEQAEVVELSAAEILAQMGQLAKSLELPNPGIAKQIMKQAERLEKKGIALESVPFDENEVLEKLDAFCTSYKEAGAEQTEILLVRGGDVRRMRIDRGNMYLTPTGIPKILQPSRETSAGKNPQALAFEFFSDGTFAIEPSHAGVDWKDHLNNKWK